MAKLSDEKIAQIKELYSQIGVYSQVAKMLGCSPSTVKKYATAAVEEVKKPILHFEGTIPKIEDMDLTCFIKRVGLTTLTAEEEEGVKSL